MPRGHGTKFVQKDECAMEGGQNLPHWPRVGQNGGICTGLKAGSHAGTEGTCKREGVAGGERGDGCGGTRRGGSDEGGENSRDVGCCSGVSWTGPGKPWEVVVAMVQGGEGRARLQ